MTKYRITTKVTFIGDRYLQFQGEDGDWRFIPKEDTYVLNYVEEKDCPKKSSFFFSAARYMYCSHGHDSELISFTRRYPNIQDYFDEIKRKREEYLAKREEVYDEPDTYL